MVNGQRIVLEGVPNARDLGGYLTEDGRVIKTHKLIRSGALWNLTKKDQEILIREYEVKTDIDFRSHMEADQKPDPQLQVCVMCRFQLSTSRQQELQGRM